MYKRRKPNANCYVGGKFVDPIAEFENCDCTDEDYEWYALYFLHHTESDPDPRCLVTAIITLSVKATSVSRLVLNRLKPVNVAPTTRRRLSKALQDIARFPGTLVLGVNERMNPSKSLALKVSQPFFLCLIAQG